MKLALLMKLLAYARNEIIFDNNFHEVKISLRLQYHYEVISFDASQI